MPTGQATDDNDLAQMTTGARHTRPIKPLPRTRPRSGTVILPKPPNIQGWSGSGESSIPSAPPVPLKKEAKAVKIGKTTKNGEKVVEVEEISDDEEVERETKPVPKKKLVVPRECVILDTLDLEAIDPPATAIFSPRTIASVPANGRRLETHLHYHRYATMKNILDRVERQHAERNVGKAKESLPVNGVEGNAIMASAIEELIVALGKENHTRHPVAHFTFLDTRFFLNTEVMIDAAKSIIKLFEESGVPRSDVCVSLPASQQGILAAKVLEAAEGEDKILTNLTEVSCLEHALACVEAGASCITMNIGEVVKWFDLRFRPKDKDGINLGIMSIRDTARYLHEKKVATKIFGSGFRSTDEVELLVGYLDALIISQELLEDIYVSSSPRPAIPNLPVHFPPMNVKLEDLLQSFSALARSIFTGTTIVSLQIQKRCMQAIQMGLTQEMRRQTNIRSMDWGVWLETYAADRKREDEAWKKQRSPRKDRKNVTGAEEHGTGGRGSTPEPEERGHIDAEKDRRETATIGHLIRGLIADEDSKAESSDTIEWF
ncbi:transaldolase [Moniliophthora roreri MCA 2997]|uniref:Transaldolase n=1 Tax=Moniliophthora roreri (strain MCA 2997) TaxID=1381753 RepID=V2XEG1_MONRO|nr:transaldolase [Moniliophthora roreri MCA 2997]